MCMDDILSSNDNIKPSVARLMFDLHPNVSQATPLETTPELPFECVSMPGEFVMNGFPTLNHDINDNDYTKLVHSSIDTKPLDPAAVAIQSIGNMHTLKPWQPNLNPIEEETYFDLRHSSTSPIRKNLSTRKQLQHELRQCRQHYGKIASAVQQSTGIYKLQLHTAQGDHGANRSCTNNKALLINYKPIDPYPIHGVNSDGQALHCEGVGFLPWRNEDDQLLLVKCYYSSQMTGTILSPNDVVQQYIHKYSGYCIETDFDSKLGKCRFIARDGCSHLEYSTYMENNLWHHYLLPPVSSEMETLQSSIKGVIHTLNDGATYELWHHRLGHPGQKVMEKLANSVIGLPKLKRPKFYSCASCNSAKFRRKHIGPLKMSRPSMDKKDTNIEVGQHLHADFGFVRGSNWAKKDNDNKLVTSIDNCRAYCLVIDRKSRYIWVFHTKTKQPPIEQLKGLMAQLKSKLTSEYCTITTDLGGELAKSHQFQKMVENSGYVLKTTGAFSSAQNGLAERPNQDLGNMMRSMLFASGKGSEFWTYALRHSVFLKNRLPHSALDYMTPYEAMNGEKPNLSNLRVFGAKVHYQKKKQAMKLDKIDGVGTFMTYKGTDKVFYVIDAVTNKETTVTHATFDEAHMSVPRSMQPPMATALQQAGYTPTREKRPLAIKVNILADDIKLPKRATTGSAGFDIYSGENITILPGQQAKVSTKLSMEIPTGYYGQLLIRSGFASKYRARVEAGTIDSDYRGEIFVLISNNGTEPIVLKRNDRFAQFVLHKVENSFMIPASSLSATERNDKGFGSTGIRDEEQQCSPMNNHIPAIKLLFDAQNETDNDDQLHREPLYNVHLSTNPFIDIMQVQLSCKGNHSTKGLIVKSCTEWEDRVLIDTCLRGTPAAQIKQWSKWLKRSVLLQINDTVIKTVQDVEAFFSNMQQHEEVTLHIGLTERRAIHDATGIPMMYFDQLVYISKHLQQIKNGDEHKTLNDQPAQMPQSSIIKHLYKACTCNHISTIHALQSILPKSKLRSKRLTRRKLKSRDDWNQWNNSEFKQLQQYEDQDTFGQPCPLPPNANCLNLLWAYSIKSDGTLKARCVCNGQPSNKNTAIFGYTYARALDQVGAKIFWSSIAIKNMIVRGADASNAFAEAAPPKIPLYVRIDDQFREWWRSKGRGEIPAGYVLPVKRALQGHPEAPRAWATKIDSILQNKLNLKPTTHEPCLYYGTHQGKEVLFLRQVDDFAVGCVDDNVCKDIINLIDQEMSIEIKDLGLISRFNGLDVTQSRHYVKISNEIYIDKIINEHPEMFENFVAHNVPIPAKDDKNFVKLLEQAVPPSTPEEQRQLQLKKRFNYRQAVGELIFAMVTCRPDISFPLIKLSQYSQNPAAEHYDAIVQIFQYLHSTKSRGIYYWRKEINSTLPSLPCPQPKPQTHQVQHATDDPLADIVAMVDSDWAGDSVHRKSVTGIVLKLAGGAILYKSKYQETVALSSTEAEFAAACEAGKSILYVRSILNEINISQDNATVLHIDNNGALLMGNAQQPTCRTKHVDIKKFALLDWIQHDLLIMQCITTTDNCADSMTKSLGRILHYRHFDYVMGHIKPTYTDIEK